MLLPVVGFVQVYLTGIVKCYNGAAVVAVTIFSDERMK